MGGSSTGKDSNINTKTAIPFFSARWCASRSSRCSPGTVTILPDLLMGAEK
ncbi:hypothetical protein [Variovorax sp. dw_954]|uniref:hypothetical protein n=1 Tax=Variovorax sp. dw_954 TaxID=2720078 RepID=UPI001BD37305|nr:hypothetical protein [Variovorax sp. dw_954]